MPFFNFVRQYCRDKIISAIFIIFSSSLCAESLDSSLCKINSKKDLFQKAADHFSADPNILKSVVLVERTLNFDWTDEAFDVILSSVGQNSSIGFCQIKLKTAYWIEKQFSDTNSVFYPGCLYQNKIELSQKSGLLIKKLINDSLNIHYAAAYLRIIQSFWEKKALQ